MSSIIAPSQNLRALLLITTELSEDQAKEIVKEISLRKIRREQTTPARLISLKKGHLLIPKAKRQTLEYRALLDFIQNGCQQLAEKSLQNYVDDSTFVDVSKERVRLEEYKIHLNHHRDQLLGTKKLGVTEEEAAKLPRRIDCINGFRDLAPEYFPDPDNFIFVRNQLELVCTCDECS